MLNTCQRAGHTPVIKLWPLRLAVPGVTLEVFTVDADAGTATCPNGVTRSMTRSHYVIFDVARRGCRRSVRPETALVQRPRGGQPHHTLQRAHRQRARNPGFQQSYRRHRPLVERFIAWLVAGGHRRLRFRGTALNDLWLPHRLAGLNLRRLLTLGLTRAAGTWVIA